MFLACLCCTVLLYAVVAAEQEGYTGRTLCGARCACVLLSLGAPVGFDARLCSFVVGVERACTSGGLEAPAEMSLEGLLSSALPACLENKVPDILFCTSRSGTGRCGHPKKVTFSDGRRRPCGARAFCAVCDGAHTCPWANTMVSFGRRTRLVCSIKT